MPNLGASELIIVLLIVIVVFGSTKLPQLGDGLGRAIKNFKRSSSGEGEVSATAPRATGVEDRGTPPSQLSS